MLKLKSLFSTLLAWVSVILFAVLVCVTLWQVFSRQVLNDPATWSEELSRLLFVWLAFSGSALLFAERGHIAVEFLARRFPPGIQRGFSVFAQVIVVFFAVVAMVWGGILASSIAWEQSMTALPFTLGWVYLIIPITGVFIAFFALVDLVEIATGRQAPYPEIDETEDPQEMADIAAGNVPAATEGERK